MKLIKVLFVLLFGLISNAHVSKADSATKREKIAQELAQQCQKNGFTETMNTLNGTTEGANDKIAQNSATSIRSGNILCIHNGKIVANTTDPLSVNKEADVTDVAPYKDMIKALKESKEETVTLNKSLLLSRKFLSGKKTFSEIEKKEHFFCAITVD